MITFNASIYLINNKAVAKVTKVIESDDETNYLFYKLFDCDCCSLYYEITDSKEVKELLEIIDRDSMADIAFFSDILKSDFSFDDGEKKETLDLRCEFRHIHGDLTDLIVSDNETEERKQRDLAMFYHLADKLGFDLDFSE